MVEEPCLIDKLCLIPLGSHSVQRLLLVHTINRSIVSFPDYNYPLSAIPPRLIAHCKSMGDTVSWSNYNCRWLTSRYNPGSDTWLHPVVGCTLMQSDVFYQLCSIQSTQSSRLCPSDLGSSMLDQMLSLGFLYCFSVYS